MKIIHTADWHIGTFKGPERDGVNLRSLDTYDCLMALVEQAKTDEPDLVLVSGDIFHTGKTWSDRCCDEVIRAINIVDLLASYSKRTIVMRGTPNHDGNGQFRLLEKHFKNYDNVNVVSEPKVIHTQGADIAVIPGFDRGVYRAKFPGLGKEEENEAFTQELANVIIGLKAECSTEQPTILMSHYTVSGCNAESGQTQLLAQFEPVITQESLLSANYDLVALGHIHRPQKISGLRNVFYSGSINANNFKDEGQERGFWVHNLSLDNEALPLPFGDVIVNSEFIKTPFREFITFHLTDTDITSLNQGYLNEIAENYWRYNDSIKGKIVRILYESSAEEQKAFNTAMLEKALYNDGAFWVAGITSEKIEASADRMDLSEQTDPEENLRAYLEEKQYSISDIDRLIGKARPIISQAIASDAAAAFSGRFVPVEIEVKNYRTYAEEKFSFEEIEFCTINGQNGAGKSSLFMDAIIDCLYEEPREGKSTSVKVPWLRNDEGVRSGYIAFTFALGDKTYRVTRTRSKSGKGTLNLAELVDGTWEDRSREKFNDTEDDIRQLIGVDSMTFKSCALIMQDQYGLFLQAKKEDRMVVLGSLLGLGIYGDMGRLAKDNALELNRVITAKKQSIDVQLNNIKSAGNVAAELDEAQRNQADIEKRISEKNWEKESLSALLNAKKTAQERHRVIQRSITTLKAKKTDAEDSRNLQHQIIGESNLILELAEKITQNADRHRQLAESEKQLIEGATLFAVKSAEVDTVNGEMLTAHQEIESCKAEIKTHMFKLENQMKPEEQELIRNKALEYEQKKEQLDQMQINSQEYARLASLYSERLYELQSKNYEYDIRKQKLQGEREALERKTALLADSGCVDLDNAKCRFLIDAVEAKGLLSAYPDKLDNLQAERANVLTELEKQLRTAEVERDNLNFSKSVLDALCKECNELKPYADKFKALQEIESQIAVIGVSLENAKSNLVKSEERLNVLKIKVNRVKNERDQYEKCFLERESVIKEIQSLSIWLEKEKQIPVAKVKKKTAEKRLDEFIAEIEQICDELQEQEDQAKKELEFAAGIANLDIQVSNIQSDLNQIAEEFNANQIVIGGLQQKMTEINRMHEAIEIIQEEITEKSEDAADYDVLKLSFGQDGIPHQIIRTVIPKLSVTANSMLGQMTGGQLGVSFITEKILKSNSKKEVVTLDIFIEEHRKFSLPYLSKSGGEKVKASLSVVLALAEMKASTAGIQFGMLFIDEPPFLDADGIQAYCDALEIIRERYPNIKIMAITHDPTMKSRFPQSLDVIKTDKGSKVIY